MKKVLIMLGLLGMSLAILAGCSSDETDQVDNDVKTDDKIEKESSSSDAAKEAEDKSDTTTSKGTTTKNKTNTKSSGTPKDQENLKIGDTATIESTLGKFEVTLESVKGVKEIDGEESLLGNLLITQLTVKNVGEKAFNTMDQIDTLEMVTNMEWDGSPDDSAHFESLKKLTGNLEPGDSVSGEAVFEAYDSDEYLLMTKRSYRAGNTVYNNAVWTIQNSEVK